MLELKELQEKNYKQKLEIANKNEQIAQIKITAEKEERRKKELDSKKLTFLNEKNNLMIFQ